MTYFILVIKYVNVFMTSGWHNMKPFSEYKTMTIYKDDGCLPILDDNR